MADSLFEFRHTYGLNPCGGVLFRVRQRPVYGDPILASDVVLTDGQSPIDGERIVCQSCGHSPQGYWADLRAICEEVSADA